MNTASLVQTVTSDKLLLQGYFDKGDKSKPVILHIHGYAGNFYENYFVHVLDEHLKGAGCSFLTGNTRGAEYVKDFNVKDAIDGVTIGARYELLEDAYKDIDAWIELISEAGYHNIVLQGHSLGTYKVVRYLSEGVHKDKIKKLILLAPFDKKGMMQTHTKIPLDELIGRATEIVNKGKGKEVVSKDFETIDISYNTWLSWYKQDDLGRVFEFCSKDYKFPALKKIAIPTLMIVGSKDEYFYLSNPDHPEEAEAIFKKYIPTVETVLIKNAQHTYKGFEDALVEKIGQFISQ